MYQGFQGMSHQPYTDLDGKTFRELAKLAGFAKHSRVDTIKNSLNSTVSMNEPYNAGFSFMCLYKQPLIY